MPLAGAPRPEIEDALGAREVRVYPQEFKGLKPRAAVKAGDRVKRGTALFHDKKNEAMRGCSPAGGVVREVKLGERRALTEIVIEVDENEQVEAFAKVAPDTLKNLSRKEVLTQLMAGGLLACIRQRPFSNIADPKATPKSIFVNGMNTAPFQPDVGVLLKGHEQAFQAGLDLLNRLTPGLVHLCLDARVDDADKSLTFARNVKVHTFSGPHPAGNTSVHIQHIDPFKPDEIIWTVRAADVIRIGRFFLDGALPADKVICVGGPAIKPEARKYYRIREGAVLSSFLDGKTAFVQSRIISGDILTGLRMTPSEGVRFYDHAVTVLPENHERLFMGWVAPGLNVYSCSPTFLSHWFKRDRKWDLNTNDRGGLRSMVATGHYDRFMPLDIMVDFLVRAILAHDTEEAIKLGILETDPEDFALCTYACISRMDIMGIIRDGLREIQAEGT